MRLIKEIPRHLIKDTVTDLSNFGFVLVWREHILQVWRCV